jgi:tRNA A-37 threonylcarbamoyl transferase component Bud32
MLEGPPFEVSTVPDHTDQLTRLNTALAGRYRLERELGQGGMATVYLAHDLKHDRAVALKVLRPELAAVLGADRFLQEIRITARLEHPHILTLIDSGESDGFLWYVTPYVRGESLRDKLTREPQLGLEEALRITTQIAGALEYAHRQGVVHRDIKPENILLHEGEGMLADFGIALAVKEAGGNRLTESGLSLGTPQYMSPEQATGERGLDARSDVYSLAAVLYEMLAGEPPHTGATAQAVIAKLMTERPTRLRVIRDTVPQGVDDAIARALAKVPADRFASVAGFAAALVSPTPPHTARGRRKVLIAAGVIAGVVVGSAVVLAVRAARPPARSTFLVRERSQLTFTGNVSAPAISPDGKQLAYAVKQCAAPAPCTYGIEIQDLSGGARRRIVDGATGLGYLAWSPDRRFLTFGGTMAQGFGSYIVSSLGGEPRFLGWVWAEFYAGGDSLLLTPFQPHADSVVWVKVTALEADPHDSIRIDRPGDQLGRTVSAGRWLIEVIFTRGHREWRLVDRAGRQRDVFRPAPILWKSFYRSTHDALWVWLEPEGSVQQAVVRLAIDTLRGRFVGPPDTILVTSQWAFDVTADGRALAYAQGTYAYDLWGMELPDALRGETSAGHRIMHSTSSLEGELSPEGDRVLLEHREAGPGVERQVLSVAPFDGGQPVSHVPRGPLVTFGWMPDGASFRYAQRTDSGVDLVVVDAGTGQRARASAITDSTVWDFAPLAGDGWAWISPTGRELRLQQSRDRPAHVIPVTNREALLLAMSVSRDGDRLAIIEVPKIDTSYIQVIPLAGDPPMQWAALPDREIRDLWARRVWWLDDGSLMVAFVSNAGIPTLYRITRPGRIEEIGTIPGPVDRISISRNGRRVLTRTSDFQGDVWVARVAEVGRR